MASPRNRPSVDRGCWVSMDGGTGISTDSGAAEFSIRDLSREFGVTHRSLHFYEECGLLSPEHRGLKRVYSRRDRARLRLILLAKSLGFSLNEAKQIIEIYDQPDGLQLQMEFALKRFVEQQQVLVAQRREIETSIKAMEVSIAFVRDRLPLTK